MASAHGVCAEIRPVIQASLASFPQLSLARRSGKHQFRILNRESGDFITVPTTPSDIRAAKNLQSQIRRLAKTGHGVIWSCKGGMS